MEAVAKIKYIGVSPIKMKIPVDIVRGMKVDQALSTLEYMPKAAAKHVQKAIKSALANAINNYKLNADKLVVSKITVDKATKLRRAYFRGKGSFANFNRPTAHVTVVLKEQN